MKGGEGKSSVITKILKVIADGGNCNNTNILAKENEAISRLQNTGLEQGKACAGKAWK